MTPQPGRGTLPRVPNQPRTPLRSFRIPDELYAAAQAKAEEKGESVSDVVRRALERYVKRP
ncbi:YlcI/YnfO family protein [Mycolicibacterium bacteremicum]|uniref:YlcI/YnfO family protein n=1 Tax=Mycolicibacterium bacteremicum TaxID=564198 RepID=UPI0009F49C38|nr:ribbon-helix-helix protein, CopG family [Mycolicibacterium bacteremicum]